MFEIFLHFHSESKINIILCTSDCEIIISEVWIIKCTKISQTCYNCLKFLSSLESVIIKLTYVPLSVKRVHWLQFQGRLWQEGPWKHFLSNPKKKKNGAMIVNNQSLNYYKSLNLVIANWPFPQEDFSE